MSRLPGRILCLVTDLGRAGSEEALLRAVSEAVRGGVNMVQVRGHDLDEGGLAAQAERVVELVGDRAIVVVNGPMEIAKTSGAAGVHLRESSTLERTEMSADLLAGKSVHSLESALSAQAYGADYVVLGTVFPSASHPGGLTGGAKLVQSVTAETEIPVVGIGGITVENAPQVIEAGASGVAVIGAIIGSADPYGAARMLAEAIGLDGES